MRLLLSPSYRLAALTVGLHGVAGGCLYGLIGGGAGTALAVLAVALGAAAAWDRALLRSARSPRAVELRPGGAAEVECAAGVRLAVGDGAREANRFWVTLPLRAPGRRSLLVTADMLGPRQFRLLRLWALWGRLPDVAAGQLPG